MKIVDKKLFVGLFLAFISATVVGTLSHEFGHHIVAKSLGFKAKISYGSTSFEPTNQNKIVNATEDFYVTLGGPLQTLITGTIGFILLIIFRKSFVTKTKLLSWQWLVIFLSLFWLRQTACFFMRIAVYLIKGKLSNNGDEIDIASYLQLPNLTIEIITAIIGIIVLSIIIFKFIPPSQRLTFIISGLNGGMVGAILWLSLFGKYILP